MSARASFVSVLALVLLLAPSAWASGHSQGPATPLFITLGAVSVLQEPEFDFRTLVEEPAEGVMGVVDYPVWGPVSVGVMGSVWHQSQRSTVSLPSGVERQFRLNALLSGGPSVRVRFQYPSEWSVFAAVHGGVLVAYRESHWEGTGGPLGASDARDLDFHNGLGFTLGLTLPTVELGGLSISAAALYEHTRFPGDSGLHWDHLRNAVAVQRLAIGVDLSFSF